MGRVILNSQTPITLVGGGPVDEALLERAIALTGTVVAADGGVHRAQDFGINVDHVIGDMDSVDLAKIDGPELHPIADQMTTDLDKCLYSTTAPFYLGVGFLGGRLDHQLAAFNALTRASDKRIVLLGEEDLCFLSPLELTLNLPVGTRISLFPMGDVSGKSKGLKWQLDAHRFSPAQKIGTSNEVDAERVELTFDKHLMLVILPITFLEDVLAQSSNHINRLRDILSHNYSG